MAPMEDKNITQIEYLVHQSTQGFHYLFAKDEIVNALKKVEAEGYDFFTSENRSKVQTLLVQVIERESFTDKRKFLKTLEANDYELLIQAYFHLVDNTILSQSKLRH